MNQVEMADQQKIKYAKEQLQKVMHQHQLDESAIQLMDVKMQKALQLSEQQTWQFLNQDKHQRRETDLRLQQDVYNRLEQPIQLQLAKNKKARTEMQANLVDQMELQLSQLRNKIGDFCA